MGRRSPDWVSKGGMEEDGGIEKKEKEALLGVKEE